MLKYYLSAVFIDFKARNSNNWNCALTYTTGINPLYFPTELPLPLFPSHELPTLADKRRRHALALRSEQMTVSSSAFRNSLASNVFTKQHNLRKI